MMFLGNPLREWAIAAAWMGGGWLVGRWVFHYVFGGLKGLASRTRSDLDDVLLGRTEQPLALAIVLLGSWFGYDHLHFGTGTDAFVGHVFEVAVGLNVTWLLARITDSLVGRFLQRLSDRSGSKMMGTVAPILQKTLRSAVWILGTIMALNNAGYNVGALLAGVGIGGLAMAMAAKDFVSNIFGGIAIFIDKPFVVGDRIQMGSVEGVVEEIGIRSTRLRNPEGRLVTVPNHKFTDSLVENISAQPSRQRHLALTVPVAMSAGELERVEAALAAVARPVAVRMVGFAPAEVRYTATYELPPAGAPAAPASPASPAAPAAPAAPSAGAVHAALLERLLALGVEGLRAE